tara:strand:+ start:2938 stop:3780 length:843 start_codon:yes stop_codon:yes gene_type:complete
MEKRRKLIAVAAFLVGILLAPAVLNYYLGPPDTIEIRVGDDGIPLTEYGNYNSIEIGTQYNPAFVANYAYNYYQEGDYSNFLNCTEWLLSNLTMTDNFSVIQYWFPWGPWGENPMGIPDYNLSAPWKSALAQSKVIRVFSLAYEYTGDQIYVEQGYRLLAAFSIDVEDGGLLRRIVDGNWWYEEYADEGSRTSMVLNGMMITLLTLSDVYYHFPQAEYLFDRGVESLIISLPLYDQCPNSCYDLLGQDASPKYVELHRHLLDEMYLATGHEIFQEYKEKW